MKPGDEYWQTKRRSVFSRPYQTALEMEEFVPPVHVKSAEQTERLMEALKSSFLTKNLTSFELKIVADAMYLRRFERGDLIIRQGDEGLEYFVLDKGTVEVVVYKPEIEIRDH